INLSIETQSPSGNANTPKSSLTKKKLSYKETRELETIEEGIADAEKDLQAKHDVLQAVAIRGRGAPTRAPATHPGAPLSSWVEAPGTNQEGGSSSPPGRTIFRSH